MAVSAFSQHCFWRDDAGLGSPLSCQSNRRWERAEEQTQNLSVEDGGCRGMFVCSVSHHDPLHQPIGHRQGVSQMERRRVMEVGMGRFVQYFEVL